MSSFFINTEEVDPYQSTFSGNQAILIFEIISSKKFCPLYFDAFPLQI